MTGLSALTFCCATFFVTIYLVPVFESLTDSVLQLDSLSIVQRFCNHFIVAGFLTLK